MKQENIDSIKDLDNFLNTKQLDQNSIEDIFSTYIIMDNYLNKFSNIVYNYKNIKVDESDAKILLSVYDKITNLLLKTVVSFLIANSPKNYNNNNFENNYFLYFDLFIDLTKNYDSDFNLNNLDILTKWMVHKYPRNNKNINKKIINFFKNIKATKNYQIYLANIVFNINKLKKIFEDGEREIILDIILEINDIKNDSVIFYYRTLKDILKIEQNIFFKKKIMKSLIGIVMKNIEILDNNFKHAELPLIRSYMDFLKSYDNKDYNLIDKNLDIVNKRIKESIEKTKIEFPKELKFIINSYIQQIEKTCANMNTKEIFIYLFNNLNSFNIEKNKKIIEGRNDLSDLASQYYINDEGLLINYNDLPSNKIFYLKINNNLKLEISIQLDYFYKIINLYIIKNDDFITILDNIFNNNSLIDDNQVSKIADLFTSFFKMNYTNCVSNIILGFENNLRFYFKNKGMNIYKKDGKMEYIDMNYIFNDSEYNEFRNELLKEISNDDYFTLFILLTEKYGFNIRNKIAHGINFEYMENSYESIFAVLQIFKIYCHFSNLFSS